VSASSYEVEKFGRGLDGRWFGFGARRFGDADAARSYFEAFVAEQACVLDNGIRIDLRVRAGRKVIATAGGLLDLDAARRIREVS